MARSRHLHDGILVDGLRVDTVFHDAWVSWLGDIVLGIITLTFWGNANPSVDVVVRRDGEKAILYRDGPYKSRSVDPQLSEVADRIRAAGAAAFLREVAPSG
jgi:hypothetical protein